MNLQSADGHCGGEHSATGSAEVPVLSVLMPAFNEASTIADVLQRIADVALTCSFEVIIVDDASDDDTLVVVNDTVSRYPEMNVRLLRHVANRGKGAAVRTALYAATGQYVLIQDADLEYDPADWPDLLGTMQQQHVDVVYGSRFLRAGNRGQWRFFLGNRVLTTVCNLLTGLHLTDMETCYKLLPRGLALSLHLASDRFGIEPEMTVKLARRGVRIVERPIRYYPRTRAEGKKINYRDAIKAVIVMLYYRATLCIASKR